MLELKNINKSFQIREDKSQHVLKDLSATFPSHGFITLLGASGNGKTTVLNIIGGLDTPDSGQVFFNNEEIKDFESFRREKVSFIFQDLNLIPHLNAIDNVILGISDETKNKKEKAIEILISLGLEESLYKRPDQLSGGQQQRVAIARTIAKNVDIIICDEPTGSLDNDTKKVITDILKELSKEKLVIFITHNLDLASAYSDMIFETVDGQIVDHSHLIKQGQFESSTKERKYNSNVLWLAFKNIIGRYKHTIRYALFIVFIMLIASASIVIQGEYVKKYMHDISLNTGIKSIHVDYNRPEKTQGSFTTIKNMDNVQSLALMYNTQIRLTTGRILEPPPVVTSDLVLMHDPKYFEDILAVGRLPEETHEVLMTPQGVITMLTELGVGGQRLLDQYATGELDANDVYELIDLSTFTVFEEGWPKFNVVGIIDDTKIYEEKLTIYSIKGFTDLFEYSSSDRVTYIELPKRLDLSKIIIYKDNVYREDHQLLAAALKAEDYTIDTDHEKKINATYNKIDTFFSLSVVFLYVIIAIASISFISLLAASIFDRKYEIGLYRTKGYTKFNIMKILGLEMYFLGFISLIVSIVILLITAYVMYLRIDYITSFTHVFKIINIPMLALALLGIITVFVIIIVYISNTIILRESVLSNIKDTGHNKKTIRKQVAIVLLLLSIVGVAHGANKEFDFMARFKGDTFDPTLYENRDDFSNVEKSGLFELYTAQALDEDLDYIIGKIYTHTHLNTDYKAFIESHDFAKAHLFDDMTKLEYMRLVKPIVASLKSVDTDLTFSDDLDMVKVFADPIYAHEGKIYLRDNTFYSDIPKGSEIISINGKDSPLILEDMMSCISAEGGNETHKYFVINNDFALNYLIAVEYAETFDISYVTPEGVRANTSVSALQYKDILKASNEVLYDETFTDTYALLTLQSFEALEGDSNKSIEFIDDFFLKVKDKALDYLILDLRGNLGGDINIAKHLMSYLQAEPSKFLDTDQVEIPMANNNFEGMLLILQDGGSSALTGQVLTLLKDQDIGIHIGQEASNTASISTHVKSSNLAHTNFEFAIATEESKAHILEDYLDQGLQADYDLIVSIDDVIEENDIVMNFAAHIVDRELAIDDFSDLQALGLLETFSKNELMKDLDEFKKLIDRHTHLYTDESLMHDLMDHADSQIFEGMTKLEFMRVLQPIAASLNAQNTKVRSDDSMKGLKIFADKVYAEEDKLFLSDNTFYKDIPVGSQITRINGRPASDIIDSIFSHLSSDGENLSYKYHLINEDFGTYYLKYVEYLDYFDIEYLGADGLKIRQSVPGIDAQTIANHWSTGDEPPLLTIHDYDNYTLLKVREFSPLSQENIDEFFKTMKEEKQDYLMLDLRGNTGGDYEASVHLLSYLVPDHPLQNENAFHGELLVLQDGSVASTAGQFLAVLKSQNVGTLIGEESACASVISTSLESTQLKHSGLVFDYSTQVVDLDIEDEREARGIMPDKPVTHNIGDIVSNIDTQLEYAKDLLELKQFYGEFYNVRMEGLFKVYTEAALANDLDILVDTLKNHHTNLYTDEEKFDQLHETIRNQLHDDMSKLEFIRLLSPLVASVNCSQTNISYNVIDQLAKSLGGAFSPDVYDSNIQVFADKLYIHQDKLYMYDNLFYSDIPITSEILSINGRTAAEIIDIMAASMPSDGDNESIKYRTLNLDFSWYYLLYVENTERFAVIYKRPDGTTGSKTVRALGLNEIAKQNPKSRVSKAPIDFSVHEDYAYLDINTFALYDDLGQKNFRFALYDFFMEVNVKAIDHVIIDLRGNYGGNPELVAKVLTYIQPRPHRYWSDTSADESALSSPLVTSSINYTDKLYVLIDGGSSSTTGHLIAFMKYHGIGTLIGEESGSSYMISDVTERLKLMNTDVNLSYSTQIFEVDTPGLKSASGIQPDYEILPTVEDRINQYDPVLDFTIQLIKRQ